MELSCSIIPQVKNKNGEIVDSKLFLDIMNLSSKREVIVDLYQRITSSFFLTENSDRLEFDENNEPTLASVVTNIDIDSILDESMQNKLLKQLKEDNKEYENNAENTNILSQKASSFNNTSQYKTAYIALPRLNKDGKLYLSMNKASDELRYEAERMRANYLLNDRIKSILSMNGLAVSALDSLEEKLGSDGIVDFSLANKAGYGIIDLIKLTKGITGEKALPEEYAHFVIEAMNDDPFIQRSLNALSNNGDLVKAILGNEYQSYLNDYSSDQLAREALGKILTLHLLNRMSTDGIALKPVIDRTIKSIKNKFSSINENDIIDAINQIGESMENIAQKAIDSDIKFDLSKIKTKDTLRHIDRNKRRLNNIIETELKRYKIYAERTKSKMSKEEKERKDKFKESQLVVINNLRDKLSKEAYNDGILDYLKNTTDILDKLKNRLEQEAVSIKDINNKAGALNNINDYLDSYQSILKELNDYAHEVDTDLSDELKPLISQVNSEIQALKTQTGIASMELFAKFLSNYLTDNTRDSNGSLISESDLLKMLEHSEKDVTTLGLWLSAAENVNDIILKLSDKAIKSFRENARNRVEEYLNRINIADAKLKRAGIDNYDFMYAKYSDGSYSPYYKTEVDYARFDEEKRALFSRLNEKYGTHPTGENASNKARELRDWFNENCYANTGLPRKEKFSYDLKFDNNAEEEYYKEFMEIRKELIKMIPTDTYDKDPARTIQIRKDFLDRLKSTSPRNWGGLIGQQLADAFQRRENEPYSLVEKSFKDFRGREVLSLPVYFVNKLHDGQEDVSRDASSTLAAFANMAIEHDELSKINDIMETGRNVAEERTFSKTKSGKPVVESFKALGETVTSDLNETTTSNFSKMYNELLESQMYGRLSKEGDDLLDGKLNTKKGANVLNRLASLNQLALNLLAGFAAVGTDEVNVLSEANANQFFNRKDLIKADKIYFKNIWNMIAESGNLNKNNKMALFQREFDLLHEFENEIRNRKYGKNRLAKIFGENSLYVFMSAGSHFGEMRVSLATAMATKVRDINGNEISLYDAYDVIPNDPNDESLGSTLKLKDGVTQLDGSPIDRDFLNQYKNKALGLNQRLFGIYNNADRNYLQKTAVGSMAMLYRKHIIPAVQRRFGAGTYNAMLDDKTEGYYRTGFNIAKRLVNDLREARDLYALHEFELTSFEKQQLTRMFTEVLSIIALGILSGIGKGLDWDDKDNPYVLRMLAYQSNRIKTEVKAFTPFGVTGEALQILNSPMATINVVNSAIDLLDIVYPPNWFDEVQSGRFKGHSKAYKTIMKSPLLPMNNTIYRALHPEETMQYFNLKK